MNADTIFLGDDFSGDVYFSDHAGTILGQQTTGFDFNHGMVRKPGSYLIAEDFTTNGATCMKWTMAECCSTHGPFLMRSVATHRASATCALTGTPCGIPCTTRLQCVPFAYAYKWLPGDPAPLDTVPLHGEQPYGIALRGDTPSMSLDNLNGDQERIYAYDLSTDQDLRLDRTPRYADRQ
ncbi:MAG: hypothetical protein IPO17_01225 [Flavobacteriales bacterium]|nr:hypothetical protein [Flavobacteriales bacterium]